MTGTDEEQRRGVRPDPIEAKAAIDILLRHRRPLPPITGDDIADYLALLEARDQLIKQLRQEAA